VFRLHGEALLEQYRLSPGQQKAMRDIVLCRTRALGGHQDMCDACGHVEGGYNSCGNRHCPKCQAMAQARWIEERKERILPTYHFHVVFTLPAPLRPLALRYPREIYDLLFRAASATLLTLAGDEKHLGATPAVTAVLHTWTRELELHPHLHVVVSGGGLAADGRWVPTSRQFLFPVLVLSRLFRGKFLDGLARLLREGRVHPPDATPFPRTLDDLYRTEWVVYAERPFAGAGHVFEYLGRYTHRVAISNERLLGMDERGVHFRTRADERTVLPAVEFLRRFLLHVLPRGLKKIRHYGLLAPSAVKTQLPQARRALEDQHLAVHLAPDPSVEAPAPVDDSGPHRLCPRCRRGHMSIRIEVPPLVGVSRLPLPLVLALDSS